MRIQSNTGNTGRCLMNTTANWHLIYDRVGYQEASYITELVILWAPFWGLELEAASILFYKYLFYRFFFILLRFRIKVI